MQSNTNMICILFVIIVVAQTALERFVDTDTRMLTVPDLEGKRLTAFTPGFAPLDLKGISFNQMKSGFDIKTAMMGCSTIENASVKLGS